MIELKGSIHSISIKRDGRTDDIVRKVTLEVFGPVEALNELLDKPVKITVESVE